MPARERHNPTIEQPALRSSNSANTCQGSAACTIAP